LQAKVPKGTNIHDTIGLSVIFIHGGFKYCRKYLIQFRGTSDCQGIFHYEFIPEGKIVNKEITIDILHRLRNAVRRKRPEIWRTDSWFLLHDNTPAHRSVLTKDFLTKNMVTTQRHPPYSLDLAAADFYLSLD
jgi:hypothetical protein